MTLRHRLTLLVAAALMPPLLLTFYNVVRLQVALDTEARSKALVNAFQISAEFAQMIESTRQLITVMSKHPAVSDDPTKCAAYFKSVIADLTIYREAAVIDAAGKVQCSTGSTVASASRDIRESVDSGDRFPIHQLAIGALSEFGAEEPLIRVSMPVIAGDSSPKGAIGLALNTKRLAVDFEGRPWKPHSVILILNRQGSLLLSIPRGEVQQAKVVAEDLSPRLASASAGVIDARGFEGRPQIVGFASVQNVPDGLVAAVAIDRNMALQQARSTNLRSLVFAAIAGIGAIACTWFATHILITRPIRAIAHTARRREAGEIGARFPELNVSTEFGQLSTALARMSQRINELLEQKSLLLRELQHRVMNSLTLLSSVLEIQRRHVPDAATREQLARARDRVVAVGSLYRCLYQTDTPNEVDFSRFLNLLCQESQNAYAGAGARAIAVEAEPLEIPGSIAIALAIVTHELITNALKHAYPDGETGLVWVKLERSENGSIVLRVGDRGRGLELLSNVGDGRDQAAA